MTARHTSLASDKNSTARWIGENSKVRIRKRGRAEIRVWLPVPAGIHRLEASSAKLPKLRKEEYDSSSQSM